MSAPEFQALFIIPPQKVLAKFVEIEPGRSRVTGEPIRSGKFEIVEGPSLGRHIWFSWIDNEIRKSWGLPWFEAEAHQAIDQEHTYLIKVEQKEYGKRVYNQVVQAVLTSPPLQQTMW